MDVRTLIFSLGLLNITLALVVFFYRKTILHEEPLLRLWQHAKLIAGVGYVLGWVRPLLPEGLQVWAHLGNVMQVLGIATEFVVYARYLGAVQWVPTIQRALFFVLPVFVWLIVVPESRHPMIVFGTGSAGLLFLGMSVLYWQRVRQSPELLHVMGATNALLASVLLFKAGAGLSGHAMVPYNANLLNIVLYAVALWVMCVNGVGFLLLVQQQADRALRQTLQQLAQSEASERELLRLAAHEFRTPAAMVKASVDSLALLDKDLPPEVVRRHHNIRLAVDRMTDLAGKLITRDRFQNAATAPQKELLSLSLLVDDAVRHYPPETPLRLTLTAPMAQVLGDPILLRVAMQNLIDNALAYSPPGVEVEIGTYVGPDWCRIEVKDWGTGVPTERKAELLTGRFSASGSLAKGVGLSLVKSITESHGGQVTLTDNQPHGSVFSLQLPLHSAQSATQA